MFRLTFVCWDGLEATTHNDLVAQRVQTRLGWGPWVFVPGAPSAGAAVLPMRVRVPAQAH